MFFDEKKISDQYNIGRDQKKMRSEKSKKKHDLVISRINMRFKKIKDLVIELIIFEDEHIPGNKNKKDQWKNKYRYNNNQFCRKQRQFRPNFFYTFW